MILFADHPHTDPDAAIAAVGGKAASLWRIHRLGLPVPPSFTLPILAAGRLAAGDPETIDVLVRALPAALARLEAESGRRLGDGTDPLMLSVRSGAAQSMPGMMDTILNLGAPPNATTPWLAACRLQFELQAQKLGLPVSAPLPDLLLAAIRQIAASWNNERARAYRAHAGIGHDGGTAVTVQAMVLGNRDARSATGVVFSRCPDTGAPGLRGDLLFEAQGEAVVAGHARTLPVSALAAQLPEVFAALSEAVRRLEAEYRDLVDIEFTVESGRLWILQARTGKRGQEAASRIGVDLAGEGIISRAEAVARTARALAAGPVHMARGMPLACGLGASAGLASGPAAFDTDAAIALAEAGTPPILVRAETSPEDVPAMSISAGILTSLGGPMCHAALVAREWGLPAVVGCEALVFNGEGALLGKEHIGHGTVISIDGASGRAFLGTVTSEQTKDLYASELRRWAEAEGNA